MTLLVPQPLTAANFAPYGRVLQVPADGAGGQPINSGTTQRHELLADAQLTADGGRPVLSISRAQARALPMALVEMERHALGSQSFVPLGAARRLLLVVARPGPAPRGLADLAAFVSDGAQGVWLAPGTWHHPLLALDAGDFLVVERRSGTVDCDVVALVPPVWLAAPAGGPAPG
jgi:ureidoglycolate lyase